MDGKRLASALIDFGLLIMTCAAVWWAYFYYKVFDQLYDLSAYSSDDIVASYKEVLPCLFANTGGCGVVSGLASFGDWIPYSPITFWIGAVLFIVGIVVRSSV